MIIVGLMSGTSADGGCGSRALWMVRRLRSNGKLLAHTHRPHPPALRDEIFACFRPETGNVERLCAELRPGPRVAAAALEAIAAAGLTPTQADLIGSHGQTVWHIPDGPAASTLQIGEAAVIAG